MAPRISDLHPTLDRPILCAVLDAAALGAEPTTRSESLFSAGVDWIQIRDRSLEDDALFALTRAVVDAAERSDTRGRVIVNRRTDVALAARAHGVHLGFDSIDAAAARSLLGPDALVGASLHSVDEVQAADARSLSYVHLAPIWDPVSKPATRPALGPGELTRAAAAGIPILAQGGLDETRAGRARLAGARGIAVTGKLSRSDTPAAAAGRLRRALDANLPPAG
jgi:thiamine-phosphate pyrophosphorylase